MHRLLVLGLAITLVGFALVLVGSASGGSNSSAGGVVFIGPVPIVFGSGPGGGWLALLSVVIGAITIVLVMVWGWRLFASKRGQPERTI